LTSPLQTTVLVTGASGSLGRAVAARLAAAGHSLVLQQRNHAPLAIEVARTPATATATTLALDLTDESGTRAVLDRMAPAVIVHTAAATDVDWCEDHRDDAHRINVLATRTLASWAGAHGSQFIYTSTDLVFDGRQAPYDEAAAVNPLSFYARTKCDGEGEARAGAGARALILRVALLYGEGSPAKGTFLDFLRSRLARGEAVTLFRDQYRTPVWLEDVARVVEAAIARGATGLYHVGGPERLSRYAFGESVAVVFGYGRELLHAGSYRDHGFRGDRPADVSLSSGRVSRELALRFHAVNDALAAMASRRADRPPFAFPAPRGA